MHSLFSLISDVLILHLFFFVHLLSPHLYLPVLPLICGLWPHLSVLIHCSAGGSIERLCVRRSRCLPPSPH